jgi:transcriptional regulator with GAF, ATPase, and Fis domain
VTDIDILLRFIVRKTKELLDVEGASIMFYDQERNELYFPVVAVEGDGTAIQLSQFRFPIDYGIAGWVVREGEPALVQDVSVDDRFYGRVDDHTGFVTNSALCVPLHGREDILGVLEVVNKKSGEFTEDDQSLLEAIADNIAVSVEREELYRDLRKTEALLRRQNAELRMAVKQKYRFENIVGVSDEVVDMLKKAEQVALTDSTVLINGETGTGKEVLAQAIHQSSTRSTESFVPINCGAVPESLLESELFGHEKGAFTGASAQRIGRFEEANGGTLFLDEIGDMPLNLQVQLLRVLQEGVIQRLGNNQDIHVDVRVIAATHQDLAQLVMEGKFRQDLYYRLKVFSLTVPPLRDRRRDIPLLVNHFIKYYNEKLGRNVMSIEDAASEVLQRYDYPGNIRELQHIIESAMVLCSGTMITVDMLPDQVRIDRASDGELMVNDDVPFVPRNKEELAAARAEAQKRVEYLFLTELLSSTNGNVSEAARKAGMNRSWLTELIGKHGLGINTYKGVG